MASPVYDQMTTAIRAGDWDGFIRLLPGFDLKEVDHENVTQLMHAASCGRLDMLSRLVYEGAGRARMESQSTALMFAADAGHADCVDFLLPLSDADAQDDESLTALLRATSGGHAECVRNLIPFSDTEIKEKHGRTALTYAVIEGHADCVALLLAASDYGYAANFNEYTLGHAISAGHADCVRLILDHGTQATAEKASDAVIMRFHKHPVKNEAKTFMLARAHRANTPIRQSITGALARSKAFFTMSHMDKTLLRACESSSAEYVSLAIKSGSKPEKCMDYFGESPLIRASRVGNINALNALKDHPNLLRLGHRDALGHTAIQVCAAHGHHDFFKVLLDIHNDRSERKEADFDQLVGPMAGPISESVEIRFGHTGSQRRLGLAAIALSSKHDSLLNLLYPDSRWTMASDIEGIADSMHSTESEVANRALFECLTHSGPELVSTLLPALGKYLDRGESTPLMVAIAAGNAGIYKLLIDWTDDLDARDSNGWSALHWAAFAGDAEALRLLIESQRSGGAPIDLNAQDIYGNTALGFLAKQGYPDLIKQLVTGADAKIANKDGQTPLIWAAVHGGIECAAALLAWSDVKAKDINGHTALDHAIRREHPNIADMIRGYALTQDERRGLEEILPAMVDEPAAQPAKRETRRL